jgi:hypothetical protein
MIFMFFFSNPKIDTENANNFLCNSATYSVTYLILTGIVHGLNTYIQVDTIVSDSYPAFFLLIATTSNKNF